MEGSIRKKGLKKIGLGIVVTVGVVAWLLWRHSQGRTPNSLSLIGIGAMMAVGLVGLLEVLMNRPFSEMEAWWGGLQGWQRGVIGLSVVAAAFGGLFGLAGLAAGLGMV